MSKLYNTILSRKERNRDAFMQSIFAMYEKFGYPINSNINGVNILGIRSTDKDTSRYNDVCIFFAYNGINSIPYICEFTTDPSNQNLLKPINPKGCAILKEGYYNKIWSLGYHKQRKDHPALVQTGKCIVYRDNNKNDIIDSIDVTEEGLFGINCHRASLLNINEFIGLNSAGCQVFKRAADLKTLIGLCENDIKLNKAKSFAYALFKEIE